MLDFACKKIKTEDLIKCSFALSRTDYTVFNLMMHKSNELSINKISEIVDLERSTVQKSIKRLLSKNLVERKQKNIQSGGYVYYYVVRDKEKIKLDMIKVLNSWFQKAETSVKDW